MSTLQTLLQLSAAQGDHKAIVLPEESVTYTYSQLSCDVSRVAGLLRQLGIGTGSKVVLILPNGYPCLSLFLAVTWTRAIAAPLNGACTLDEYLFYLEDIKTTLAILLPGAHPAREAAAKLNIPVADVIFDPAARALALAPPQPALAFEPVKDTSPPQESDVALMLHTSGTTSRPKLVPLTHLNLYTSAHNGAATYALAASDVTLIVMPLFHVHGLVGAALATLSSGGTLVVPSRFSASAFWPTVANHHVTWYTAVPTIHQILLSRADTDKAPKSGLRFIRSCSAALAPAVLQQLEARFGAPVLEAYGMTEASHQMASNPLPQNGPHRAGSVGKGVNVEIGIVDDAGKVLPPETLGEVCIRGKNVTPGYYNNEAANKANWTLDGWFRTGDQGTLSADGYVTLTGRIKELINRGGEKIAPLQVDAVLLEHPDVAEGLCFAVPDAKYGEEIEAAIVLKPGASLSEEKLSAFVKERVAAFKVPKRFHFVDALPRSATGKLQRRLLTEHFTNKAKDLAAGAPHTAPATGPAIWLLVHIHVKLETLVRAEVLLSELAVASRGESGCVQYDVIKHHTDPLHFVIVELWRSKAALDSHNASEHFKRLAPQLGEVISKPRTVPL